MARTRTARPSLRSVLVGAVLALVLGSIPLVAASLSAPAADAHPNGPNGTWRFYDTIHYGTSPEWNDPSHTAYAGRGQLNVGFQTNLNTMFVSFGVQRDRQPDTMVNGRLTDQSATLDGIPGAEMRPAGGSFAIICVDPIQPGNYCNAPSGRYTVTLTWRAMVQSGPCVWSATYEASGQNCPEFETGATITHTVVNEDPPGTDTPPVADFDWEITDRDTNEVTFENLSSDAEGGLTYEWDFGDDSDYSEDEDPVHVYEEPGTYEVTLFVTDTAEYTSSATRTVDLGPEGLVVNSTGDEPATDAAVDGCDTGGTVGSAPECTLRAAIQTANVEGGGDITFDVDTATVPTIAAGSALPRITQDTTIDGATQPGAEQVQVTGSAATGIELAGGTSTVSGLVLSGFATGILTTGGTGHTVSGNVLAADPTGTSARDGALGIEVRTADTTVADNVVAATVGVLGSPGSTDLDVSGNRIGVGSDGAQLGTTRAAVVVLASGATVTGNQLRGESVGAVALGAPANATTVSDNTVGLSQAGVPYEDMGYGIRIDGAPGATVSGNRVVSSAYGAIAVSGGVEAYPDGDELRFNDPSDEELGNPVTGGGATITGNTVAIAGSDGDELGNRGIVSWAGATNLVVTSNTIGGVRLEGIELQGGSGHRVAGNTVGSAAASAHTGIRIVDAPTTTIGGSGSAGNTLSTRYGGVAVEGSSTGARVQGNTVRAVDPGAGYVGIDVVDEEATDATVDANVVTGGETGIGAKGGQATVRGNRVVDATQIGIAGASLGGTIDQNVVTGADLIGIGSLANEATVSENTVSGSGTGLAVDGNPVTITENRIGLAEGSSTVMGNEGAGIAVEGGKATVGGNQVAGSGGPGIDVQGVAKATLKGNRVWRSTGLPIAVADGPDAPTLVAAVRSGSGATLRRTLVLTGLPEGDAGTIEVFANSSCTGAAGGEAELLMNITRTKQADEQNRVVQVKEQPTRDHFTAAYTDADGHTSELSDCVSGETFSDDDGDGAPDPLEAILGLEDDPAVAILATDDEELLLAGVLPFDPETGIGGGHFESIGVQEDPTPSSHPAGWSLPYGALGFRVGGLAPGARTAVALTTLTGSAPIAGSSYWKYGPATPGAAPSWYRFDEDEASGTRAVLSDAAFLGGEVRRSWLLLLGDGLRGDSDGAANGTITDPGGPVVGGDTDPTEPTTTTAGPTTPTTAAPVAPTTTTTATPTAPTDVDGGGEAAAPLPSAGALSRTGGEVEQTVSLGLALVLVGAVVLLVRRRRLALR